MALSGVQALFIGLPGRLVVLVVRNIYYAAANAGKEPFAQQRKQFYFTEFGMLPHRFRHVDGPSETEPAPAAEMEIIAIFDAGWHYHHVFLPVQGSMGSHGYAKHPFVDWQGGMHRTVAAFGEHAERHPVRKHVHHLVYGFVVAEHFSYAVAPAHHG